MDGLLIIDKPAGITSHDVVNRVRRILGTRRVGHTGTLDPFATGVMVVVVGRATRLAQFLDKDEKEYEATIRFGFETDTGDATGSPKPATQDPRSILRSDIAGVLPSFTGVIDQVPPMYSAKKVDGKKLYESARKGIEIERESVRVTIRTLELIDDEPLDADMIRIRVACTAGTYIRVLAEAIGRVAGIGAHLTELRRTRSGRFDLARSISLEHLGESSDPASALLPVASAVEHLPKFALVDERVERTRQGMSTRVADTALSNGQKVRMTSVAGELIAIGEYSRADAAIKPKVVLV